jgi:membrane protease YdiL (CAAX protease family)
MSLRLWLYVFILSLCLFALCGYLIAYHSNYISSNSLLVTIVLALAGLSLFLWPLALGRAFQIYRKNQRDS